MEPLRFAAAADSERTQLALGLFCRRLELTTGLSIQPVVTPSYAAIADGVVRGVIELAWAPPLVAISLLHKNAATPIVVVRRSLRAGYHSALFVRDDAPQRDVRELNGVRVAWVSPDSASGYFVPRLHLQTLGIDPKRIFREERFVGSHDAVAQAVLRGESDVGATHVALDAATRALANAPWMELGAPASAVRVLLLVGPIPSDVIVASVRLAPAIRRQLTAVLLTLRGDEMAEATHTVFASTRFEPVPDGHLSLLEELTRAP